MKSSRRLTFVAVTAALLIGSVLPVQATDLESELAEVEAKMDEIAAAANAASASRSTVAGEIQSTEATMAGLLADLGQTRYELSVVREDLAAQQEYLNAVRSQLRDLYLDLAGTRAELGESEDDAAMWAVELYKTAGTKEAGVALVAEDLSAVSIGLAYLDRISENTDRAILRLEALQQLEVRQQDRIEERESQVAAEVVQLGDLESHLRTLEVQIAERQAAVEAELATQQTLLRSIEDEIAHFETELDGLAVEQDRIAQAIADASKPADDDDGAGGTASGFVRPVPGPISSAFGPRLHPILGYARMHTGLDFSAPSGQNIRAASGGTVILATFFGGYGNTVVINHGGGLTTLYAHQSGFAVSHGARVSAGDVIGYVGSTGLSTGAHLHFEVRVSGTPVDPLPYL